MKTLLIILIAVFVLTACERQSHSGRRAHQKEYTIVTPENLEKVIILDGVSGMNIDGVFHYKYKVCRIEKDSVFDYIYEKNLYDVSDRILVRQTQFAR